MARKKKQRKKRKQPGTPRDPGAHRRRRLHAMSMGCLALLVLLAAFLVLPRLLSGSS